MAVSPKCLTREAPRPARGARAAHSSTSIVTGTSICSSPTTSTRGAGRASSTALAGPPPFRDSCLPLFYPPLTSALYRNPRRGTFEDISAPSGVGGRRGNGLGVAVTDIDDDGWPDLVVANDSMTH